MVEWDVFWKFTAQFVILFVIFTLIWLTVIEVRKEKKKD